MICVAGKKVKINKLTLAMAGDWYEYASYGDGTTRLCYKCMKLSFTKEGNEWIVKRDYVLKLFNVTGSSLYAVKQVDNRNFILEGKGWTSNLSMWILGADYDHYLILWSCEEHFFGMYHTESSWIITKYPTETLTDQLEEEIKSSLKNQNIDLSWYGPVTQNSCPYNY
ncbi:lazarillo protein-like isoform X2 [Rhodnius prolixus]|uniref:lazarillo protein-like isoform X2 n=1 Tax=Rhodnius prolixus TaxID=13249 RepID=UPI003D18A843